MVRNKLDGMITAYEALLSIDDKIIQELKNKGYMRASVDRDVEMYEYFMNERKTLRYLQARENTAKNFKVSDSTIDKMLQRIS